MRNLAAAILMTATAAITPTAFDLNGTASAAEEGVEFRAPDDALAAKKTCDTGKTYWYVRDGKKLEVGTNLHSDWFEGPGSITYSKTATAETNGSYSGEIGVSADAVIAKVDTTYGKTVGKSTSHSASWSYRAEVPKGKTRRLQQLKEAYSVVVYKWHYTKKDCSATKETDSERATFPIKGGEYSWMLIGRSE